MKIDNPTLWLWNELEAILEPEELNELRSGFRRQSEAYNRAAKIRQVRRDLNLYERNVTACGPDTAQHKRYKERIAKRKDRLQRLLDEQNDT
jgi:hypothetical protein